MMILITIVSVLALAIAIVALFLSLLVVAAVNKFKKDVAGLLLSDDQVDIRKIIQQLQKMH